MSVVVNRKRSLSLESTDIERQQQILFDLSVMKLHQEQGRQGMEPRLLRFVLINNALRTLQGYMMQLEDDDGLIFDDDGRIHGGFVGNTFKHGGLTSQPVSPPTPVKMLKLDTGFGEQSPLLASCPVQLSCCYDDEEGKERDKGGGDGRGVGGGGSSSGGSDGGSGGGGGGEEKLSNGLAVLNQLCCDGEHLDKRLSSEECKKDEDGKKVGEEEEGPGDSKRPCRPHINGTRLNGTTGYHTVLEQLSSAASGDFAKVDPALYDYDTRTNLQLPTSSASSASPLSVETAAEAKSSSSGCAMDAVVYQEVESGLCNSRMCLAPEVGAGVRSNSSASLPEGGEGDFLEDLDHIVSLLMT